MPPRFPARVVQEMLCVGKRAIVGLPNWVHWRCRVQLLVTGRIPQAQDLAQAWHAAPRWQAVTITDFAAFCKRIGVAIVSEVYLVAGRRVNVGRFKNLLATTAIFTLERAPDSSLA